MKIIIEGTPPNPPAPPWLGRAVTGNPAQSRQPSSEPPMSNKITSVFVINFVIDF